VQLVQLAPLARKDRRVPRDPKALPGRPVRRAPQVLLDRLDHKEMLDRRDR